MMNFFMEERFRRVKFYQSFIGHWPYNESKVVLFKRGIILIAIFHYFIIQFFKLRAMDYDVNLIVEILAPIFAGIVCLVKNYTQLNNMKLRKELLERAKWHWKLLNDQQELQILYKCVRKGMLCEKIYVVVVQTLAVAFSMLHILPCILDIIAPLDEPRPRRLPFLAEYFVDEEKYFYPILLHMILLVVLAGIIVLSTDLFFLSAMTHACGMYLVVGYQLERIFDDFVYEKFEPLAKYKFRLKLKRFVDTHTEIIKFVTVLNCCYTYSLIIQWLLAIITFAVVEFQLFRTLLFDMRVADAIKHFEYAVIVLLMLSAALLPGQMLCHYSSDLFYKAYFGYWYCACVEMQKPVLLIMQKTIKPAKVLIGNYLDTSFETLAMSLRLSASYFMVIYSMRDRILPEKS